jgi:hypothetical protein
MKTTFHTHQSIGRMLILVAAWLMLAGCAAAPAPDENLTGSYLDRTQTQEKGGIRVTAAVPSAAESKELFGKPLYKLGIQPVWLKIENQRADHVSFLPVGLDPAYFTPTEAANIDLADREPEPGTSLVNRRFFDAGLSLNIPPGEERSGFIFSELDEGTKSFNVDVIGKQDMVTFTFFIPVPGLKVDHYTVDWKNLYPGQEPVDLSRDDLIAKIESSVCCVMDAKGENFGDPLNLVVIGELNEVYYAFIRAGWDETETIYKGSLWKTFQSFVSGGEYRYSPVSALYVFNRPQDVAFQKARSTIHERNHLRLWVTNSLYQGKPVWIGQISRDIGVRFTRKTITTHKIDPNVDETREYLLENLAYSQALQKFAYLRGVGEAPIDEPRGNLTGDPYFTDGYRIVLWVSSQPVDITDLEFEFWRTPPGRLSTP